MKKPEAEILAEFNKGGIHFLEEKSITQIQNPGEVWLGLSVEIAYISDKVEAPDFSMSILNKRGHATIATDFSTYYHADAQQKVLRFEVYQRLPDGTSLPQLAEGDNLLAMSFMDLCFYTGNEAVIEGFSPDTFTEKIEGYTFKDLGWYLPSRFVDSVIDALGKLNDSILAGQMQEALLYHHSNHRKS